MMDPLRRSLTAALVLSFAPAAAAQAQSAMTVPIVMTSYRYSPSPIVLNAGQPVRLAFQNRAGKAHDFVAPEFFKASRILSGQVRHGAVDLAGGKTRMIELVPVAGTYPVHCSKFMHSALGMKAQIVVR